MTMTQWIELQLQTIAEHGDGFQLSELVDKALQEFGDSAEFREDMIRAGIEARIESAIQNDPKLRFLADPSSESKRRWNS